MIKRPIFVVAVAFAMVLLVVYRFFPQVLEPRPLYEDGDRIIMTGEVYKTERRTETVRVFLKRAEAGNAAELPTAGNLATPPATGNLPELPATPVRGYAVLLMTPEEYDQLGIKPGNRLYAECGYRAFRHARNYGNFEEEGYYHSIGVFLLAKAERVVVTDRHTNIFRSFLNDLRESLVRSIYAAVNDPETAGILAAICTGDRSGLTEETRTLYQSNGIIHILAVSGLHISMIGMTIFRLLRRRFRYPLSAVISLFLMLGFCIMSSASPSTVRATIMFAVQIAGIGLGKQYDIICSLSLAAILMLLGNPLLIINTAFQLSFAAMLGVGFVHPVLERFLGYGAERKGKAAKLWQLVKSKLISGFLMSLSVNLALLPIVISTYYEIPLYSILLNLIVIPLMSVILGMGLASSAFGMVSLLAGRFLAGTGVLLVVSIRWLCEITDYLPGNNLVVGALPAWRIIVYYVLLIIFIAGMKGITEIVAWRGQQQNLPPEIEFRGEMEAGGGGISGRNFSRSSRVKTHRISLVRRKMLSVLCCCLLLLAVLFIGRGHAGLRISFIDVGQGEGILIDNPSGSVILIDGGSSSVEQVAKYNLTGAIKYYGIDHIDYAVITHPDEDHISGIMEILEKMSTEGDYHLSVRNILIPYVPENVHYSSLLRLAADKGVHVQNIHAGMQITDGDLVLTCLHPDVDYRSDSANGYSAVLDLRYGAFSALLTGDLEEDGEQILLSRLNAGAAPASGYDLSGTGTEPASGYDLLKVAHHGSRFSSGQAFLEAVSPKIAVISAGVNNIYGHPHKEILERLRSIGAGIYVTAWYGEIIVEAGLDGTMTIKTKLKQ